MSNLKKISAVFMFSSVIALVMALSLSSCAREELEDQRPEPFDPTELVQQLESLIKEMSNLKENAVYGTDPGMNTVDSKVFMENSIAAARKNIDHIKVGSQRPLQGEIEQYIKNAEKAIKDFKESVVPEGIPSYSLFVNGLNGGYIDFGYEPAYSAFGQDGNQAFTVEFWINISAYYDVPGEDNSTMLSTYIKASNYRTGWRMYSRNNGGTQVARLTIANVSGGSYSTWEPLFNYNKLDEWLHFTMVYSDAGLDEKGELRAKMYANGVFVDESGAKASTSTKTRVYSSQKHEVLGLHMTAFASTKTDGTLTERLAGSMKNLRIWNKVKTDSEIMASFKGEAELDPSDPNLVCGWDFTEKPENNSNEIMDITGRYKATLKGDFSWKLDN